MLPQGLFRSRPEHRRQRPDQECVKEARREDEGPGAAGGVSASVCRRRRTGLQEERQAAMDKP